MDAETRHQLKTNELGEALRRLGQLEDPRLLWVLVGVLVVLIGWAGYRYVSQQRQQEVAQAWESVVQYSGPAALDDQATRALGSIAQDAPNAAVSAAARLRLRLSERSDALDAGDKAALGGIATELLAMADSSSVPRPFRAAALYAAGVTHEDQGLYDEARAIYRRLQSDEFGGSPFSEFAQMRIDALEGGVPEVVFKPGMPPLDIEDVLPADEPAAEPDAEPAAGDAVEPTTTAPADDGGAIESPAAPAETPDASVGDGASATEPVDPDAEPEGTSPSGEAPPAEPVDSPDGSTQQP